MTAHDAVTSITRLCDCGHNGSLQVAERLNTLSVRGTLRAEAYLPYWGLNHAGFFPFNFILA